MTKGRKALYGTRLTNSGLTSEVQTWYKEEAGRRAVSVAHLKRLGLVAFMNATKLDSIRHVEPPQDDNEMSI